MTLVILSTMRRIRMVEVMNYSAGMVSQVFAFVETKKTAELMMTGMSKDEIKNRVVSENFYQLRNETRLRKTFNYVYNRLLDNYNVCQ